MAKITDYKYRQLRKMVKRAKVRKPVKNLLLCAISDYKKQASIPQIGTFQEDKKRCLVGAALHNVGVYIDKFDDDLDWEDAATEEFGLQPGDASNIIEGFDNIVCNFDGEPTTASQALANEFGRGNRVAFLANRISLALVD